MFIKKMRRLGDMAKHSFESGRSAKPDRSEAGLAHKLGAVLLERSPHARFNVRVYGTFKGDHPHYLISG